MSSNFTSGQSLCNLRNSSATSGGIKSGRVESTWPSLIKFGPSSSRASRKRTASGDVCVGEEFELPRISLPLSECDANPARRTNEPNPCFTSTRRISAYRGELRSVASNGMPDSLVQAEPLRSEKPGSERSWDSAPAFQNRPQHLNKGAHRFRTVAQHTRRNAQRPRRLRCFK